MDITKSLFNLVKNNNGLFKSEKQAEFLTRFLESDLTYFIRFNYNLGIEYNNKRCGSAEFVFFCDTQGIFKVVKTTSKGKKSVYFERKDQATFEEEQARKEKQKLIDMSMLKLEHKKVDIHDRVKLIQDKYLTKYMKDNNMPFFISKIKRVERLKANSLKLVDNKLKQLAH